MSGEGLLRDDERSRQAGLFVERLRADGWSDGDVLTIVALAGGIVFAKIEDLAAYRDALKIFIAVTVGAPEILDPALRDRLTR
jgi:hypothetical protein